MKSGKVLVATAFALTSLPFLAQQPSPATQPSTPPTQPSSTVPQSPATPASPAAEPAQQSAPAASPQTAAPAAPSSPASAAGPMSPINGELESKLDSKTAKTGDDVVVKTKSTVKTADGTEIPKGSKLMGHVIAVQPSAAGATSQMALQFDRIEIKGGQSLPIHSQIQSIGSSENTASNSGSPAMSGPPAAPAGGAGMSGGQRGNAGAPPTGSGPAAAQGGSDAPAPGTVVAQNGNIAIQTTAVPGILLANNAPGQQDPRMARASSILLGAKRDIQLDGGTQMVVGVSAAGTAGQ